MNKKWWIIGSVIVIGAGVGAYFLFRKPKEDNDDTDVSNEINRSETNNNAPVRETNNYANVKSKFPLKFGSKGDKVVELQKHLICLGRDLGRAGADGDWGELTDDAMRKSPPSMSVIETQERYNVALGRMSAVIYRTPEGRKCIDKA